MSVTAAMRDRLTGNAAIADLVGDRVYRDERVQGDPLPAIVITKVSAPQDYTHDGVQAVTDMLLQIDIWAESRGMTDAIAALVRPAATEPTTAGGYLFQQGFIEADADTTERSDVGKTYRTRLDVRVWSSPAI